MGVIFAKFGYEWNFDVVFSNLSLLSRGLFITLGLTSLACLGGTVLAIPLAVAMRSRYAALRRATMIFVEIAKGVPLLVLLVWVHYVSPGVFGFSASAFWNAVISFTINLAAFLADVLRGGMSAIPKGHIEAGESLGFTRAALVRRIIIPETVRRTLPTISAFYIGTLKLSTLASIIGVQELLFNARLINIESPHPLELYTTLAFVFLVFVMPVSLISRRLEKHSWFSLAPKSQS